MNNVGYNQLKISSSNVSTTAITCTSQTITLSGFAINLTSGDPFTSGRVRGSVHDTIYTNATSFTGDRWEVKVSSCLTSGKLYIVSAIVTDNANVISGEYYTSIAAS